MSNAMTMLIPSRRRRHRVRAGARPRERDDAAREREVAQQRERAREPASRARTARQHAPRARRRSPPACAAREQPPAGSSSRSSSHQGDANCSALRSLMRPPAVPFAASRAAARACSSRTIAFASSPSSRARCGGERRGGELHRIDLVEQAAQLIERHRRRRRASRRAARPSCARATPTRCRPAR